MKRETQKRFAQTAHIQNHPSISFTAENMISWSGQMKLAGLFMKNQNPRISVPEEINIPASPLLF